MLISRQYFAQEDCTSFHPSSQSMTLGFWKWNAIKYRQLGYSFGKRTQHLKVPANFGVLESNSCSLLSTFIIKLPLFLCPLVRNFLHRDWLQAGQFIVYFLISLMFVRHFVCPPNVRAINHFQFHRFALVKYHWFGINWHAFSQSE